MQFASNQPVNYGAQNDAYIEERSWKVYKVVYIQ